MRNGERFTLAVTPVSAGQTLGEVVRELTGHLRFLGVKIKGLYLDRGFASVEVVRAIQEMRLPAIIACPIRGSATSGVRQYCTGRASKTVSHVFVSQRYGSVAAAVALARSARGGRRFPGKMRWLAYIVIGQQLKPLAVRDRYRSRFGVETSYRLLNQIRPRTTSRNPAVRLLLIQIGVVLQNLWVKLKRLIGLRILPPHGFRLDAVEYVDDQLFRMARFKLFLRHALERRYPPCLAITHSAAPP